MIGAGPWLALTASLSAQTQGSNDFDCAATIRTRFTRCRPGQQAMIGWRAPTPASEAAPSSWAQDWALDLDRWETVARGDCWARLFVLEALPTRD